MERETGFHLWGSKSLIITVFGGLSLLGGIILLSVASDSFSLHYIIQHVAEIQSSPFFILAMIFILIGAFTKSAQVPFTYGYQMQWKHQHLLVPIYIRQQWLKLVYI